MLLTDLKIERTTEAMFNGEGKGFSPWHVNYKIEAKIDFKTTVNIEVSTMFSGEDLDGPALAERVQDAIDC